MVVHFLLLFTDRIDPDAAIQSLRESVSNRLPHRSFADAAAQSYEVQ